MDESKKIQTITGEMIDYTPIKYNPDAPKITQSDLDKKIKEKQARQEQLRQESSNRKMQELEAQSEQLFVSWLEATDDKTRQQYAGASRISDIAGVIRDYAMNNGIDLSNANDNDVVQAFMQSNSNKANDIIDYINGTTDLYTTSANIWFIKPQQQEESESKWWFIRNVVWGAYDSVTWIWRLIAKYGSEWIWEIAKFLWADEEKVNNMVQSYQDSLKNFSWEALWADTDSLTYKGSKLIWDLTQVAAWEWLARWAIKGSQALNALWKAISSSSLPVRAWAAALEWAADTAAYSLVADNELPSVWETVAWAVWWAVIPLAWAWLRAGKKVLWEAASKYLETAAWKEIIKMNKLSKWVRNEFEKKFWINYWDWLNDRGIVGNMSDTVDWLATYMSNNKDKVDEWLAAIKGTFKNKNLNEMADDVAAFAEEVSVNPEEVSKYKNLAEKAKTEWLTMSEINDVKRYYERNNKFTYGRDTTQWAAKKSLRATNLDNAVRERQIDEAAKRWFDNLREMNKETAASKYLLDKMWDELKWTYGNSNFWLSDYIIVANMSPETMVATFWKRVSQSEWFRKNYVNVINKLSKHQKLWEKMADLETISKINSEKELEKWLESDYNSLKLEFKDWEETFVKQNVWQF